MVCRFSLPVVVCALVAVLTSACSGQPLTTREKGILGGGALGAGTGAIIGAAVGHPGAGAAIGGGLGALTGGVIGNEFQNHEIVEHHLQSQIASDERRIEHQRREIERLKQEQELE
jgi:uncharacterized protein YcfJ